MPAKTKQKRSLYKSLNTVTPLSKAIAFTLFILMPFIGFYLGMNYQKTLDAVTPTVQYILPLHNSSK